MRSPEWIHKVVFSGLVCATLLGTVGNRPLVAQADEAALFLLLPVGAQAISVGRTMTGVKGPESAFWNPAGLAGVEESRFLAYRGDMLAGESTALTGILARNPIGVFAVSYQLLDGGTIDETDSQGNKTGEFTARNHLGIASVATGITRWLDVGVNVKVFQFNLSCRGQCPNGEISSTGWAIDAGLQARPFEGVPLRFGAMVAHLGPDLQAENAAQADPLPSRMRFSVGYDVLDRLVVRDELQLWVDVELEDRVQDPGSGRIYHLGTELIAGTGDQIMLRAGYQEGEVGQADGFSVGVGLRFDRFDIGLAKNLAGSITGDTEPIHVSFGLAF